jgi:redox-sensitive bicupin YhaK (pirin superfamily)
MPDARPECIALVIEPESKDLGEFAVRRSLPDPRRQRVGPFIFFDHIGPADFRPGTGVSVRPHPHIGLTTVTYLFDGVIVHRDSLGHVQPITSGAVNWMTAGKGIVHSERSPAELVESGSHVHGVQTWMALPRELEETEPRFEHYPASVIPKLSLKDVQLTIIAGEAFGSRSPVRTSSETIFVEASMEVGSHVDTPDNVDELAVYAVSGDISIDGYPVSSGTMIVLRSRTPAKIAAHAASRLMFLGGSTIEGERLIWWNFVSSSRERIDKAKKDWLEKRFAKVPGESEFIPLPEK